MNKTLNIALIPIDNRPVSYTLPKKTAELNSNVNFFLPPRKIIGGLTKIAEIEAILDWLESLILNNKIDLLVCSLDTIAYGGLVSSRRSNDDSNIVIQRLNKLKNLVGKAKSQNHMKFFAFSSIMRISNNNINEEEKDYWNEYGELIFKYSALTHKKELGLVEADHLIKVANQIPEKILQDYQTTRARNFDINRSYFDWVQNNSLDFLVFSQDDTSVFGMNVLESQLLNKEIENNHLQFKIKCETGADEIPIDLISKGIMDFYNQNLKIYPVFSNEKGKNIISRYENRTIQESVIGQSRLCGLDIAESQDEADILLFVHTPAKTQNDHAMQLYSDEDNSASQKFCIEHIKNTKKPFIIADVANANGADDKLVAEILKLDLSLLLGFAAWNTTGNTLGSAISLGACAYLAENQNSLNINLFKKLMIIRLVDDWAYQSKIRQVIRAKTSQPCLTMLKNELSPHIDNLVKKFEIKSENIQLFFPWDRTFEVEVDF